jgi:hypothetical protein
MIITRKYIQELREESFMKISPATEELLIERLGQESEADENGWHEYYTEQDIWEQARKIIQDCQG